MRKRWPIMCHNEDGKCEGEEINVIPLGAGLVGIFCPKHAAEVGKK